MSDPIPYSKARPVINRLIDLLPGWDIIPKVSPSGEYLGFEYVPPKGTQPTEADFKMIDRTLADQNLPRNYARQAPQEAEILPR